MRTRPVVGIIGDYRVIENHPAYVALESYIAAVRGGAEALPLLVPALDPPPAGEDILAVVDGLFFTGSPSNVSPKLYGGRAPRDPSSLDERRDALVMPLIRMAVAAGVPVLSICRGLQEMNVAFGGTLHQHLHELAGHFDHREREDTPLDKQYAPAHDIAVLDGGLLAGIVPSHRFRVNSLHGQGIDKLAPTLHADAVAPDGLIEAVSMPGAKGFLLAVQWHPEWRWADDEYSRAIFAAFGKALCQRRAGP